ncbi:hypothetical protein AMECASPLE_029759, partial [Ameca splendens]
KLVREAEQLQKEHVWQDGVTARPICFPRQTGDNNGTPGPPAGCHGRCYGSDGKISLFLIS